VPLAPVQAMIWLCPPGTMIKDGIPGSAEGPALFTQISRRCWLRVHVDGRCSGLIYPLLRSD
jgi:hypothetical protein